MMEEEKPITYLKLRELVIFREYLIGLRNHYGPYHERKEQIAWAAITIYMTAIFVVIVSIVSNFDKVKIPLCGKVGFIVLLSVTTSLLFVFLKNEFKNRVFAAEMVRVVGELLAKLSNPEFKINAAEMDCRKYQSEINGVEYVFPLVFCDHLDKKKVGDCEYFNETKVRSKILTSYDIFRALIFFWTLAIAIVILLLPSP